MPAKTPISQVMTRDVYTLDVNSKLSEVRRALIANDFHHMPILDGDELVGILSWRDLVRAYRALLLAGEPTPLGIGEALDQSANVADLMSRNLVRMRDDDPLERAINLIADGEIHSVLVVDTQDQLVGIVTDKNIVEFLMN